MSNTDFGGESKSAASAVGYSDSSPLVLECFLPCSSQQASAMDFSDVKRINGVTRASAGFATFTRLSRLKGIREGTEDGGMIAEWIPHVWFFWRSSLLHDTCLPSVSCWKRAKFRLCLAALRATTCNIPDVFAYCLDSFRHFSVIYISASNKTQIATNPLAASSFLYWTCGCFGTLEQAGYVQVHRAAVAFCGGTLLRTVTFQLLGLEFLIIHAGHPSRFRLFLSEASCAPPAISVSVTQTVAAL